MPNTMKPMTGVIRNREKAGITIPAAPKITSASCNPVELVSNAIGVSNHNLPGLSAHGQRKRPGRHAFPTFFIT